MPEPDIFNNILTHSTSRDDTTYHLNPCTVKSFFENTELRRIPDYQRPYSWEKRNIIALLKDISKIANGERESWFLGPLFTTKFTPDARISDLLDGQQRVTTIQIILTEAIVLTKRISGLDLSSFDSQFRRRINLAIEDCKNCVYRGVSGGNVVVKFETESSIKELLRNYILDFVDVNDETEYKNSVKQFEDRAKIEVSNGSKTAATLINSRAIISKYISDEFILDDLEKGLEEYLNFLDSLLYKCWIIEVPLLEIDSSIQIFESLNNRGKSLTLTDKLRYKCLINCEDKETYINQLKSDWKKIYMGLDLCTENGFIKNDEDFFKIFFNVKKGKSISDEDEMVEYFEIYYLNEESGYENDDGIKFFMKECLTILDFYKNVFHKNLDADNSFLNNFSDADEQNKVKSLIQLCKKTSFSENSRFLLFGIILKYYSIENENGTHNALIIDLWIFIRIIFIYECLDNKKSNTIRNNFLKIISDNKNNWNLKSYFNDRKESEFSIKRNNLNDVLCPNDNGEAKFILYLYTYLNEHNLLSSYSVSQYKFEHLEHMFPTSWQNHWSDKNFTVQEIHDCLKNISSENNYLNKEEDGTLKLVSEIKNKDNLTLYSSSNAKQKDTLIQFIGNKWVIHAASNISGSNNIFGDKKLIYNRQEYLKLPSNSDSNTGLDLFNDFGFEDIISRSLKIIEGIFSKFYANWDDI